MRHRNDLMYFVEHWMTTCLMLTLWLAIVWCFPRGDELPPPKPARITLPMTLTPEWVPDRIVGDPSERYEWVRLR